MYKTDLYEVRKIKDIRDMMRSSVEIYGEKAAFLVKNNGKYEPVSFNKFKEDVEAFGTKLADMGLLGKRVAVIGENRYEWAVTYMAVVCGLGIIVPLDKELPKDELYGLIGVAEVDAIVYSPKMVKVVEGVDITHKINMEADMPSLIEGGKKLLSEGNRDYLDVEIDPEVMSILLFTSGTTADAKAVMLSHKNIVVNLMAMCSMTYIDDKDVFLSILPLHHTYECTCGFLCQIYRGCTIAYCEGLRHIVKNFKEAKVTMMLGVPLLFESMYKRIWQQAKKTGQDKKLRIALAISNALLKLKIDLRRKLFASIHESLGGHLRLLVCGAAAIDPEVSRGFRSFGIDIIQGYGLTECSPIAALNRDVYYKDDAAGLPMPGVKVKIKDPDSNGNGEILISGDNVMLGYYKNKEATDAVLRDGWFHSGDIGHLDKENFLYITGRKKNVIVTKNGKNIFPEELETYLTRSPYILEALVHAKDEEGAKDTIVIAQIVPDFEAVEQHLKPGYKEEELKALIDAEVLKVNQKLQNFKRIGETVIRKEEFIKTTTKKIKRHLEIKQ